MATTELCFERDVLVDPEGRRRVLASLRELCREIEIEAPPTFEDGWLLIPAEPVEVFSGLQRVDPEWSRFFELFPSDGALRRRALRVSARAEPAAG